MKKHLIAVAFIITPPFAHAEAPLCPHYELSELQGMSDDQLDHLLADYTVTRYSSVPSGNYTTSDDVACAQERSRINAVVTGRLHSQMDALFNNPAAQEARQNEAIFEKTPEGKIYASYKSMCYNEFKDDKWGGAAVECDMSMSVSLPIPKCGTFETPDPNDPYKDNPEAIQCLKDFKPKMDQIIAVLKSCNGKMACMREKEAEYHFK